MPNLAKPIASLPRDVGEAVGKPLIDEVGTIVDETVNNIFGQTQPPKPAPNPQADVQRKADEERRRQNILRYFDTLKANAASYKQSEEVKTQQKKQEEVAQEQKVKQFQFQTQQKKQQSVDVYRAQRKSEIKVKGG